MILMMVVIIIMIIIIIVFNKVEREPILACDFAELVALIKVIFWKTYIPVRTPK